MHTLIWSTFVMHIVPIFIFSMLCVSYIRVRVEMGHRRQLEILCRLWKYTATVCISTTKSHRVFNAPLSLCWNVGYTCRYYQIQKRPKIIKFYSCAEHILFWILKLSLKILVVRISSCCDTTTYNWFANQPFIQWRTYDLKYYYSLTSTFQLAKKCLW